MEPGASMKQPTTPNVQPAIDTVIENLKPYGIHSTKKQQTDSLVLDVCVIDMQPLSIVEDRGFKALICAPDPRYKMVSRKTLRETLLPKLYKQKKMELMIELATAELGLGEWNLKVNHLQPPLAGRVVYFD